MTTSYTNIIAFPVSHLQSSAPTVVAVLASAETSKDEGANRVVSISNGGSFDLAEEEWLHAAAVVRASIRFARRKGVSLDSLPSMLRMMLLRQCDRGEPACLMVWDWLTGNRSFLGLSNDDGEQH